MYNILSDKNYVHKQKRLNTRAIAMYKEVLKFQVQNVLYLMLLCITASVVYA